MLEYIISLFFLVVGFITKDTTFYIIAGLFCIAGNVDSFRTSWLKHHNK